MPCQIQIHGRMGTVLEVGAMTHLSFRYLDQHGLLHHLLTRSLSLELAKFAEHYIDGIVAGDTIYYTAIISP